MIRFLIVLCAILFGTPALAGSVSLEGNFTQGGLVLGLADPGTAVTLDDTPIMVSAGGLFLLGFGQEAKKDWTLLLTYSDGTTEVKRLSVEKRQFKEQRIEGLPERKVTPNPADVARIKEDNKGIGRVRATMTDQVWFSEGFVWPVKGRISGVFGSRRILNGIPKSPHRGTDIAAPIGTPVTATTSGIVALVHPDMFYTGKTMMIDHGHGLSSVYAHMDSIAVKEGDHVAKGQQIGTVGKSGRATGPHLHWGLSLGNIHLDPQLVVE